MDSSLSLLVLDMSRAIRLRLFVDFLRATRNEIAVDLNLFRVAGLTPERYGFFPRVSKWASFSKARPRTSYFLWVIFRAIWLGGGASAFFLVQFIPNWLRSSRIPRFTIQEPFDGAVLALSSRVGDLVHPSNFQGLPNIWITVPWAPLRRIPVLAKPVDVFSLLSRSDLYRAYYYAVCMAYTVARRRETSRWVLQSYTAFRWFAVRFAIDKLSGRLVMAEHYDRWAVLVDSSVRASKTVAFPFGAAKERELLLIQHGSLGELCSAAGKGSGGLMLPRKLGAVSHLYAYGSEAEKAFERDVLTEGCVRRGLKVHYFKPTIELTDVAAYSGVKLLFVGHPLCEVFQERVFDDLRSLREFKGYYKPHPMAPMSASMKQVGWEIIENVSTFPLVDLLIAYPSTLVVEYEGLGIPAAVHPINLGCEGAVSFVKTVCELIDSIKTKQDF